MVPGRPEDEGDTGRTHTLVAADKGKKLHAVMTGSKSGYARTRVITETAAFDFKLTFPGKPKMIVPGGTPVAGLPIYATVDYATMGRPWYMIADSYTYQWNRNGKAIAGARSDTYVVTLADVGAKMSATVRPITRGLTTNSTTSEVTAAAVDRFVTNTSKPKVTGTAKVGGKLTATAGVWNKNAKTFSYQWFANGVAIKGATASSYKVAANIVGKKVTVKVTATGTAYSATASSHGTAAVRRL